jgi:hypothetical protein
VETTKSIVEIKGENSSNLELELIILKKEPYNEQQGNVWTITSRKRKLQRIAYIYIYILPNFHKLFLLTKWILKNKKLFGPKVLNLKRYYGIYTPFML